MSVEASTETQFRRLYVRSSSPLNALAFRFLDVDDLLLKNRVQDILFKHGLKPVELADAAGVTKGLVSQWMKGDRTNMGYDAAKRLSQRYGYAINWLIEGKGPKMASDQARANERGADLSDLALEIGRSFDKLSEECKEHVQRQIELLRLADVQNGRRAAQHDLEIKSGKFHAANKKQAKKSVR